nr:hypothetical protein [Polyangiaceae bacterium]
MKRLPIVATLALAAYGCGLDSGGDSVVFSGGAAGVGAGTSDAALGGNAGVSSGGTNSGGVSGGGASGAGGSSGSSGAG